jgi:hypothetical protein
MDENIEICKASEWSTWGECTKSCGGGIQYSTRYPLHDHYNEYDCGSLSKSRECNTDKCPIPLITIFKHIDYKEKKFIGWSSEEINSACENKINILTTSDSFTLYYNADHEISPGLFLEPPSDSEFFNDFTISTTGEFVYANGKFLKIKNRELIEIVECDLSNNDYIPVHEEWCGTEFTKDSFICIHGTRETGGVLNTSISDRYYYNQLSPSLKTEWMSRNNLLKIVYISATDQRNELIKRNTWSLVDDHNNILYYTIDFNEMDSCPPLNSNWIPVYPMMSNNFSVSVECDSASESTMSCDLKDAYIADWFDKNDIDSFSNIFEKNLVNHSDVNGVKNDFYEIITRGSGLPSDESNIFKQSFQGHFNINKKLSNPAGVGVSDYFENEESGGDILHKIEFPLVTPVDLVNVKLMSKLNKPGSFHVQAYSIETQQWVHVDTINHFTDNQQIVTDVKNDNYNSLRPPFDGSDVILESVVAVRLLFGTYDYNTQEATALQLTEPGQGMMIHSFRIEGRDSSKCSASEVDLLTTREVHQIVKQTQQMKPKLYESFTEIVGDLCIGNIVYGNYKYEGIVDEIYYTWNVNDTLVSNARHLDTSNLQDGSVLKFEVTFVYDQGIRTSFHATATVTKCKIKVHPAFNNFADFNYVDLIKNETDCILVGYDWPDVACATTNTNYIRFYWTGNLQVGKQVSTEEFYQSIEHTNSGLQYFLCIDEQCVVKLSKELIVVEIIPCPPDDFNLILDKFFAIDSDVEVGTRVGRFSGSPVNKNIKYQMNNNAFGIHNDLFDLTGGDPVNNIQNVNLIVKGDVSEIGTEAKLSVSASNHLGDGNIEKNFTINIRKSELQRYAECTRIQMSGFECDFMNGNYGLVYHPTLSSSHEMGYAYHNKKLLFRTTRKFTDGFVLLDGTVEFGSGHIYSEIKWEDTRNRWELYVHSDDMSSDTNFNESYNGGKLCAYSNSYSTSCPVKLEFVGISPSFGVGKTESTTLIEFGDDFHTDCTERDIC